MPVKVEMDFKETLDYILELHGLGKNKKLAEVRSLLEVEVNNTEIRMKNAELELRGRREPLACGPTPEDCLRAFSQSRGWLDEDPEFEMGDELNRSENSPELTWGYRFLAGGTSFKGAGSKIPGGFLLLWWK